MTRKDRLWVGGLKGLVGSIIATLAVRWAAMATLDIATEFPPLAGPGPTIFFTAVGALGATGVFAVVRRRADRPEVLFRWIALGVLLLSFPADLWLLSDGAAGAFPGATPTAVGVLMLMHIVAAAVIVWFLAARGPLHVALASPLLMLVLGTPAGAQDLPEDLQPKSSEQYAEDAREAENSPLFASDEPLVITLRTDIKWIRDTRNDSIEVDGTIWFPGSDGTVRETRVEVRARGEFRRSKRNCNFPPLRLDFPRGDMDGTVFEGQDKLKLVTPCHDSRDRYQEYVLKEYLVYKTLGIVTPLGNRVRLVEITYEDDEDDYDTRTKFAFLIESNDQMAARNGADLEEWTRFHPSNVYGDQAVILSMFQYLIGNSDWSATRFHNVEIVRHEDGRYLTIPYDFDFAGAVNARYASPPEDYPIRRVTDRYFYSYCRAELQFEPLSTFFNGKKAEIIALYEGFETLREDRREDVLEFYEDFWEMMDDEGRFDRQILRNCKNW